MNFGAIFVVPPMRISALVGVVLMLLGADFTVTLQVTLPNSVVAVMVAEPVRTPVSLPVFASTVTYLVEEDVNFTARAEPSTLVVSPSLNSTPSVTPLSPTPMVALLWLMATVTGSTGRSYPTDTFATGGSASTVSSGYLHGMTHSGKSSSSP